MIANANCDDGLPPSLTREISYLRTIRPHENINRLVEVEVFRGTTVCLILEYQPQNLKDYLKSKSMDTRQCSEIMYQICTAMHALHIQGY